MLVAAERRLLAWLQQRGIMPRLFVRRAATLVGAGVCSRSGDLEQKGAGVGACLPRLLM